MEAISFKVGDDFLKFVTGEKQIDSFQELFLVHKRIKMEIDANIAISPEKRIDIEKMLQSSFDWYKYNLDCSEEV